MMTSNDIFQDDDIARLRQNDGVLRLPSGRCLLLPTTFGFCQGVRHAVKLLQQAVRQAGNRQVWLLGAMIHNQAVNDQFVRAGANIVPEHEFETLFAQASPTDVFVIPAFGLPLEMEGRLRDFAGGSGQIIDTTCAFVRRVWRAVAAAADAGQAVLIHGKPGHQETEALWSRATATAPAVAIIPTIAQAEVFAAAASWQKLRHVYSPELLFHPESLPATDWCLVNQTTMLCTETAAIAEILQNAAWHQQALTVADTLCAATYDRQSAALELCRQQCDVILVLGGIDSSNTNQLYRLAKQHAPTFFLQSPQDIEADLIRHFEPETNSWEERKNWLPPSCRKLGILAGASCPDSELGNLIRKISGFA